MAPMVATAEEEVIEEIEALFAVAGFTPPSTDELFEKFNNRANTDEMLARAVVNKGGRPRLESPRQLISLRLPPEVIERWRATGPGWQTRMAERLAKGPTTRAKSAA